MTRSDAIHLVQTLAHAAGLSDLDDTAAQNSACILQATIAAAQAFLVAYIACMKPTPPPTDGYEPGERNRCQL